MGQLPHERRRRHRIRRADPGFTPGRAAHAALMATWAIGDLQVASIRPGACSTRSVSIPRATGYGSAATWSTAAANRWKRCGWCIRCATIAWSPWATTTCRCSPSPNASPDEQRKGQPDLQAVLFADDRDALLGGCAQPLLHVDRELGWMMVHAGLAPKWTISMAERHAREVERACAARTGASCCATCTATSRCGRRACAGVVATARSSTCSRACATAAARAHRLRGRARPARSSPGLSPVVRSAGRSRTRTARRLRPLSALGLMIGHGVHAIDTGAVWGGKLIALRLDGEELRVVQVPGRDVPAMPRSRSAGAQASAAQAFVIGRSNANSAPASADAARTVRRHSPASNFREERVRARDRRIDQVRSAFPHAAPARTPRRRRRSPAPRPVAARRRTARPACPPIACRRTAPARNA